MFIVFYLRATGEFFDKRLTGFFDSGHVEEDNNNYPYASTG